jgi:hypothetical protein
MNSGTTFPGTLPAAAGLPGSVPASRIGSRVLIPLASLLVATAWPATCTAQMGGFGFGGAVGGISIDAEGIVRNLDPQAVTALAEERRRLLGGSAAAKTKAGALRKVSLARVVAAVEKAAAAGQPVLPGREPLAPVERTELARVDGPVLVLVERQPDGAYLLVREMRSRHVQMRSQRALKLRKGDVACAGIVNLLEEMVPDEGGAQSSSEAIR